MADELTERIIGAAIEVHRVLGCGLLESVYEGALCHELFLRRVDFKRQVDVTVLYKDANVGNQRSICWSPTRWWLNSSRNVPYPKRRQRRSCPTSRQQD